jgi:Ca2+:H+ antiporter
MGKSADLQDNADRNRSWMRHLPWTKSINTNILPTSQPGHANQTLADRTHNVGGTSAQQNITNTQHNGVNNLNIEKSAAANRHDAPVNTEAQGEKPAAMNDTTEQASNSKPPMTERAKAGSRRFLRHTKNAILHSYINLLLVFVPLGIAVKAAGLSPTIVFAMNAIAVVPLAGLLAHATEAVASRLGDTLGALLNVSFGNAVELIILYVSC